MNFDHLLKKYPHIKEDDMAAAVTNEETDKDILVAYTRYMKEMELDDPDSDRSIKRFTDGMVFIFKFLKKEGLTFEDYVSYSKESMPCWVGHLKQHDIMYYNLHAVFTKTPKVENDILEFVLPDFFLTFQKTKNRFYHSKRMKELSNILKPKLEKLFWK